MKFIRVNGRIVPIRDKNSQPQPKQKKKSAFQKDPVGTGAKKGLKYGATFGAAAGAAGGLALTALGSGASYAASKMTPHGGEQKALKSISKIAAGIGVGFVAPAMAAKGALKYGVIGAGLGAAGGAAYKFANRKKKKK